MINSYHVEGATPKRESFERMFLQMRHDLTQQPSVNVGEWQSQHKDEILMKELLHVTFDMQMPSDPSMADYITGARMPWAEDHFQERVGGEPLNPSPSEAWWPFRQKKDGDTNTDHKSEGAAFSHTYPERMWPKFAEVPHVVINESEYAVKYGPEYINRGIRFDYGDLRDIVMQLYKTPMTRQAYLPIWFPEDTGAVHGKRVPCTLGYHFIIRDRKLDISYFMRSTDLLRHFQDDVYMAIRLAQWVVHEVNEYHSSEGHPSELADIAVGQLIFHTANLHIFEQDTQLIDYWKSQGISWYPVVKS